MFKKPLIGHILAVFSLFLVFSCDPDCKETLFELSEISMMPRTVSPSANKLWYNDDALTIDQLIINIRMTKPTQSFFSSGPDCPQVQKISNPVTSFKLVSDERFDEEHPAGVDLFELGLFSDLKRSIPKAEFVDKYLNESNLGAIYFNFKANPDVEMVHNLRIFSRFQDGTTLISPSISVLLIPSSSF